MCCGGWRDSELQQRLDDVWVPSAFSLAEKKALLVTRLLEEALATIAHLPDDRQDELARVLLQLAGHEAPPHVLSPEEEADLDASIAEAARGEYATDAEVSAVWARVGL